MAHLPDDAPDVVVDVDRPYHAKRPHKKSRAGCKNCKTRKVKCDEARPSCRNCVLRKNECVYLDPVGASSAALQKPSVAYPTARLRSVNQQKSAASYSSIIITTTPTPNSPSSSSGSGSSSSITAGSPRDAGEALVQEPLFLPRASHDALDMKLLWFYSTTAWSSFHTQSGLTDDVESILKVKIPNFAFENEFLMDTLLGLSAIRLQHLGQHVDQARVLRYRARAFQGYRRAIEAAEPSTFPSLLACSLLLVGLASQPFREREKKELYILDWMTVWRGIGLMIGMIRPKALWASGMATLFYRPKIDLVTAESHIPPQLLLMVSSIPLDDPDLPHLETYYEALKYLATLYTKLRYGGFSADMSLHSVTWFTFLRRPFIELASARHPRALIIIAHYCMFTKLVTDLWWMKGIADAEIPGIWSYVGDEYAPFLAVPMRTVGVETRLTVARIILEDPSWEPPNPASRQLIPLESPIATPGSPSSNFVNFPGEVVDDCISPDLANMVPPYHSPEGNDIETLQHLGLLQGDTAASCAESKPPGIAPFGFDVADVPWDVL